jgi:hypothetical protein
VNQLTGIILLLAFAFSAVWVEESYPPVLLARKAHRIRLETKNWAIHAKSEETGTSFKDMSRKYLIVPFEMFVDPIAFFMNLYSAFTYAIIYLFVLDDIHHNLSMYADNPQCYSCLSI